MSVILCTAGYDRNIRFWEALSGICSRHISLDALAAYISGPVTNVNRLCISPDKRYLAAAITNNVVMFDIASANPNPVVKFTGHTAVVTGIQFHCEGKWLVTSSEDGHVKIWDTKTGKAQRDYDHKFPINDVVIHPNMGELIACDQGGNVRIWDLGENKCSHQLVPEESRSVNSVTVAVDGSLFCASVSTSKSGNIYVWRMIPYGDLTTIAPVTVFQAHQTYITRILLSPDVRHLATCSADHTVRIWSVDTTPNNEASDGSSTSAQQQQQQQQQQQRVRESGFTLETELDSHQRWVWDCAFSADSAYLVTVCTDHFARLWELATKRIIKQYSGHHKGCVCVALNDSFEGPA